MSKYVVDGTDLTGIADAIREESGMNMYDPVKGKGYVRPNTTYTYSKTVVSDGHTDYIDMCHIVDDFVGRYENIYMSSVPAAGTAFRVSTKFTTTSNDIFVENRSSGLAESNFQLEKGNTATTYNAYQKLEFPDGFVSALHN